MFNKIIKLLTLHNNVEICEIFVLFPELGTLFYLL